MSTDRTHQFIQLLSKAAKTGEEGVFEDGVGGRFRVTVELVEEAQEEPRWHVWSFDGGAWAENPYTYGGVFINKDCVEVYGTRADRDAKRDDLLEAARKAGKP